MSVRYSIWLMPAKNDQAYLQNVIQDLSLEYKAPVFLPHCTLYSPTDMARSELEKILKYVANGASPLSVTANRLNITSNIWKTFFIELEKSNELSKLQQKLMCQMRSPKEYDFMPHISLIYKEMSTERKKEIIEKLFLKNSYKMDKISVVETGSDVMNWKNIIEIKFNA